MPKKYDWSPTTEALKEALRVIIFALVSWGIAKLGTLPQNETVMIGIILLRALDKWLHEKNIGLIKSNGLTGF